MDLSTVFIKIFKFVSRNITKNLSKKTYNTLKNNIFIKIQLNFINEHKTSSYWRDKQ